MDNNTIKSWRHWLGCASLMTLQSLNSAQAAESLAIIGKDDWLFLRSEILLPTDRSGEAESIGLINKFNKLLSQNGIQLVMVLVPVKMRIYQEHLPANAQISADMAGHYDRLLKDLQSTGVSVVDLNTPFLSSPQRIADDPLYYRLDGHWSFSGVRLAAEAVRETLQNNPALKKALSETPVVGYERKISKRKKISRARDLITLLPPQAGPFAMEYFSPSSVVRTQPIDAANLPVAGITVQGSSFSQDWSGFVDSMRYELQRDILNVSIPATIGSWYGMESYLSSDAFQNSRPKIIIWERPEYTLRAPPDFKYQDARYMSNNSEWLLHVAAWLQKECQPAAAKPRITRRGLAANAAASSGEQLITGPTQDNEYIEIDFDRALDAGNYFTARVSASGGEHLTLEGVTSGGSNHRQLIKVEGDQKPHLIKAPLLNGEGRGFVKLRIYPGRTQSFNLQAPKVCQLAQGV